MTRDKFIEKWGNPLFNEESPGQSFASDLDELLKERAVAFAKFNIGENYISEQRESEWDDWYDSFIKEQP